MPDAVFKRRRMQAYRDFRGAIAQTRVRTQPNGRTMGWHVDWRLLGVAYGSRARRDTRLGVWAYAFGARHMTNTTTPQTATKTTATNKVLPKNDAFARNNVRRVGHDIDLIRMSTLLGQGCLLPANNRAMRTPRRKRSDLEANESSFRLEFRVRSLLDARLLQFGRSSRARCLAGFRD